MLELRGNYLLNLTFGETNVGVNFGNIKEFVIIQDMNKFLPSFSIKIIDAEGTVTHINPFDKSMSRMFVEIGASAAATDLNSFKFMVYRRKPQSYFSIGVEYSIVGLLDMEGLFVPEHSRAAEDSLSGLLQVIAGEMGCDSVELGTGLDKESLVIQPLWTNARFLTWLKKNLGDQNNTSYHIFVKVVDGKSVFVCKSLQELCKAAVKYSFIINDERMENFLPVFDYSIFDNYKIFGLFGAQQKGFNYFSYDDGEYKSETTNLDNFLSMADYFAIDAGDTVDSTTPYFGRTNEFTGDFTGRANANYHKRVSELVKMWILTWGLPNVAPGDIVRVLFGQGVATGELFSYQYSGYWLVERVVHLIGSTHRTRLLLTRNGLDTDKDTTLLKASKKRR
jgi:hypothetical protein